MNPQRKSSSIAGCLLLLCAFNSRAYTVSLFEGTEQSGSSGAVYEGFQGALQWAVSASLLPGLTPGHTITGIAFRLDGQTSVPSPARDLVYPDWSLQISRSANAPGLLSDTFADNQTADLTLVYSGAVTVSYNSLPFSTTGGPAPWAPVINFQTPYTYNGGDLLFTLRARTLPAMTTLAVDAAPDNAGAYQAIGTSVFNGTIGHSGLSTPAFQLTVVPEPTAFSLCALTGFWLAFSRQRSERK